MSSRMQEPRAQTGDWIYGLAYDRAISHLVTEMYEPRFSSLPHAITACGRVFTVGWSTMCTRRVGEIVVPHCERCES